MPQNDKKKTKGGARQPDLLLRCKVEEAARKATIAHFEQLGYEIDPRDKDNLGWDLDAKCGLRHLRLEVKGLSGSDICVELTPNEYAKMKEYRDSYYVCIVHNALVQPILNVFSFNPESAAWQDEKRRNLKIDDVVAARCRVVD